MQSITQFGFLGNAILLGPQCFGWALSQVSSVAPDNLREVEDLVPPLLDRLEKRGEDVPPARAALENLRRIERGNLTRAHFAPLAAGLKCFSEKHYIRVSDEVAIDLMAAVSIALEEGGTVSGDPALFAGHLGLYAKPILEMEQINKISAPRTLAGDKQEEMILILKAHLGWSRWFLEEITEGTRPFPPEEVLDFFASVWMESFGIVDCHLAFGDPELRREFFWRNFYFAKKHFPGEIFSRHLGRLGKDVAEAAVPFVEGTPGALANEDVQKLQAAGLVNSLPYENKPDAAEQEYRAKVFPLVFEAAFESFSPFIALGWHIAALSELEKGELLFYRLKGQYPNAPYFWLLHEIFREIHPDAREIFLWFHEEMLGRHVAALPEDVFQKFKGYIERDFPEALYYRKGLRKKIDREVIEKSLKWRKGKEKIVMHIGVKGDLELVRASLRGLGKQGTIVLVDGNTGVFAAFQQDPEIGKACRSGRVVLEETGYEGYEDVNFRGKYAAQIDRVYLLHMPGDPVPVFHDIVAPGGVAVYQQTDWVWGSRYYQYDHRMFVTGDFENLAGYANGPAWFETETAKFMRSIGMRFSVGRRRGG